MHVFLVDTGYAQCNPGSVGCSCRNPQRMLPRMTPDEFRRLGHRLIDWVADYRERIEALPVISRAGELHAVEVVPVDLQVT